MSTITESSAWSATVNQIESGELLEGGAGNLLNQASGSLANRTLYLRDRLDDSSSAIDKIWSASKIQTELDNVAGVISIRSANYTVTGKNEYIFADTSGSSWTLTLPVAPVLGDVVSVNDLAGTWDSYPLTISRNSQRINGLLEDLLCDINNCCIKLMYSDVTYGWKICS